MLVYGRDLLGFIIFTLFILSLRGMENELIHKNSYIIWIKGN